MATSDKTDDKGLSFADAYDIQVSLEKLDALREAEGVTITGNAELSSGRNVKITVDSEAEYRAVV